LLLNFIYFFLFFFSAKSLSEKSVGSSRDFISDNTHFNLWTRSNQLSYQELINGNALNLAASNFDVTKPTKIFAHGWLMNGYNDGTVIAMKNGTTGYCNIFGHIFDRLLLVTFLWCLAFLNHEDCNYIAVDWETMANNANYYASAADTLPVGILTGQFIDFLISQGVTYSKLHVIGFSLGAHVAGNAGATVAGTLPRITGNSKILLLHNHHEVTESHNIFLFTGLDPAYPGFSVSNTGERLDTSDARFVDIVHTNSATLPEGGLSFPVSIGHVDFWPNGGISQPVWFYSQ
jgi:hypothetical protein